MTILSELLGALVPVVSSVAPEFAARITVFPAVTVDGSGNEPLTTYPAADPARTDIAAFVLPGDGAIPGAPVLRAQGVELPYPMRVMLPVREDGTLAHIGFLDGVRVNSGPYQGWTFLADADSAADALGLFATGTITSAPDEVVFGPPPVTP